MLIFIYLFFFFYIKSLKTGLKVCCLLCFDMLRYAIENENLMLCFEIPMLWNEVPMLSFKISMSWYEISMLCYDVYYKRYA